MIVAARMDHIWMSALPLLTQWIPYMYYYSLTNLFIKTVALLTQVGLPSIDILISP